MSPRLRSLAHALATLLAWPALVQAADHCAPSPVSPVERRAMGLGVLLALEHATYATERYAGNFTGVRLALSYAAPGSEGGAWDVSAEVPAYQLLRNGQSRMGLGDPFVRGRVRLLQAKEARLALGVTLGLSLPLGDAEADLGMGHFMLHPGVWLGTSGEELRTEWTLGYGAALGSSGHGHDTGPLVNPMNASELSAGAALVWQLQPPLELRAQGMGAVPIAAPGGEPRATLGLGVRLLLGGVSVASSVSFPLVGDPFHDKLEVTIGHSF